MAQMSITAKIQVVASDEDKTLLDETMSVYREACNYVSDYVFSHARFKTVFAQQGSVSYVACRIRTEISNDSVCIQDGHCQI